MSTDRGAPPAAATAAYAAVADVIRSTGTGDSPALLYRAGRLAAFLDAARAAAEEEHIDAAALLASSVLRNIARDFPGIVAATDHPLGVDEEDRLREQIGRRLLQAEVAA